MSNAEFDITFGFPGPDPIEIQSVTDQDLEHVNAYAYAHVNLPKDVTATLGLSFDSLSGDEDVDKDQVNPKFGITWTPLAGTTLRGAAFRVLEENVDHRPDVGANPGGRVQPVLR